MSSTAIGLASLTERGLLESPGGRSSFSVLLFQDLAVVPCLMALTLLSPIGTTGFHWQNAAKALVVIAAIVFIGRHLLRPVLRVIAASGLREVFIAFSLLLVIGVSVLVSTVGLSMALGAFLAGVLLADSEYRHELELDLEPFKGLLLGLFFIAVGMSVDLNYVAQRPLLVFGLCGAVMLSKFILLYGLARVFGNARGDALLFGVALSQVGEFAFVLFSFAEEKSILDAAQIKLLNAVTICSMLLTPLAFVLFRRFAAGRRKVHEPVPDKIEQQAPVIVAGFGRFGQVIARLLYARGIATTVLERDPTQIELMRRFGFKAYYGDATRLDLLERAGIARARLIVLAMDDEEANLKLARTLKKKYPQLEIVARAHGRPDAYEFMELGISNVRETFAAALEAGRLALQKLGVPAPVALRMARQFDSYDRELMQRALPFRNDQNALIGLNQQARRDLSALLAQEGQEREDESPDRPSQLDSVLRESGKATHKLAD
jgi:voltage-gated potassium channel Kch